MTKVKIGVIGVGNMGSTHCNSFIAGHCPEVELVAIADRREARRNWAKETLPETVIIFEEGEDLIDSGLCDAVIIAVAHEDFAHLTKDEISGYFNPVNKTKVLLDIKGILNRKEYEKDFSYWRL